MKEMTTEQAKELIDNLAKMGTQKIGFTGGEPLIRKDIFELVDYAHKKGMIIHLVTNASLLNENNIEKLKNVDVLFISYEGPTTVNEYIRTGTKEDILDKIKLAKSRGMKVTVLTTIVKQNIRHFPFIMQQSKEIGFPVLFSLLHYHNYSAKDMKSLEPQEDELKSGIRYLIKMKKKGYKVANSYSYLKFAQNWPNVSQPKCYAGQLYLNIDVNGDVYPCWPAVGHMKALNVFKDGFKKAIKETTGHKCGGCNFSCHHELNFILSLHPNAIVNVLKNYS